MHTDTDVLQGATDPAAKCQVLGGIQRDHQSRPSFFRHGQSAQYPAQYSHVSSQPGHRHASDAPHELPQLILTLH